MSGITSRSKTVLGIYRIEVAEQGLFGALTRAAESLGTTREAVRQCVKKYPQYLTNLKEGGSRFRFHHTCKVCGVPCQQSLIGNSKADHRNKACVCEECRVLGRRKCKRCKNVWISQTDSHFITWCVDCRRKQTHKRRKRWERLHKKNLRDAQRRWLKKNPTYQRDYQREHKK